MGFLIRKIKNYFYKISKKSIFRFLGVGIVGELTYLLLYSFFISLGFKSTFSVLPSGLICFLIVSYMHAKFSFKINYGLKFISQYGFIQLICLLTTYIFSFLFVWMGMNNLSIAFGTLILWSTLSFLITNFVAKSQKKS